MYLSRAKSPPVIPPDNPTKARTLKPVITSPHLAVTIPIGAIVPIAPAAKPRRNLKPIPFT